jgi:hypothetical protein
VVGDSGGTRADSCWTGPRAGSCGCVDLPVKVTGRQAPLLLPDADSFSSIRPMKNQRWCRYRTLLLVVIAE